MTKGYFLNSDNIPTHFGHRDDRPDLEVDHTFVAESDAPPHPDDGDMRLHALQGGAWVVHPGRQAEADKQAARKALAQSDAHDMGRLVEDMWEILKAKCGITDTDLPLEARDKLANRATLRGQAK